MLVLDEELGECVVFHDPVVIRAAEAIEESVGDGEKRHMFDVRVVFGGVGHDMVDIVVAFPPADTKTADEIRNNDTDNSINVEIMRDSHVSSIMSGENKLLPHASKEKPRGAVPPVAESIYRKCKEQNIAACFHQICKVIALIQSLGLDAVVQSTVLLDDVVLGLGTERRVLG
jgi:hypothetical protein